MKKLLLCLAFSIQFTAGYSQPEIIYHVFQRSFFDSNGDGHGDLDGMRRQLNYLQELGVTTILLTPLYQSDFYHNYFATDFEKIDPAYGSMQEYLALVKEVHQRRMKIYQDVEMQYVTGKHPWFKESYQNPSSPYSSYIFYKDKEQRQPWYFFDFPEFTTYNNSKQQIAVVDMRSQAVKDYTKRVLEFWMDPNGDGRFDDGVDGFRLDHMMDDLDYAGRLTNLFHDFWSPLLNDLRKKNPALQIVAEQANWGSYGYDYITKGAVDRVFAFRLKFAIESFDKKKILAAADSTFLHLPAGGQQVVFLENHDTPRFASVKNMNQQKLRIAATLNLLMGGIPSIYYGQEIGMKGKAIQGMTDGNDIPIREAFDWYTGANGPGMALWYKNTGPWWDSTSMKPNDGISLEEQKKDPASLWNHYRQMIRLKKNYPALATGRYEVVANNNDEVLSFARIAGKKRVLVVVNLSGVAQETILSAGGNGKMKNIFGLAGKKRLQNGGLSINLPAFGIQVWAN